MWKSFILAIIASVITTQLLDLLDLGQRDNENNSGKLFTAKELADYNGIIKKELLLAILGTVFDVTKGAQYYGPGQTYHTFIGHDNSKSFVTGNLGIEHVSDEVIPLSHQEYRSLFNWYQFYVKEYTKIGKLIGRFYDEKGLETEYLRAVKQNIKESEVAQAVENEEKLKFPPCNIEWDPEIGTRVWCSTKSGGIERNWAGVPRQLYEVGAESYRCACIHKGNENLGNIKIYEGCDPTSDSCLIKN